MKVYNKAEDIDLDLKRLSLEREIALEELKAVKGDFKESLQPAQWVQTGFKVAGKLGVMMLLKKIIRK